MFQRAAGLLRTSTLRRRLPRRRQHVLEVPVGAMSALAGLVTAVLSDVAPTGLGWWDAVLVALAVAFATWAGASAPWWSLASSAAVVAVLAASVPAAVVGAVAFVAALVVGARRQDASVERSAIGGTVLCLTTMLDLGGPLGTSTVIGIGIAALLIVTGLRRRRRAQRRIGLVVIGATLGFCVIGAAGASYAARSAQSNLEAGIDVGRDGARQIRRQDYVGAATTFRQSAELIRNARSDISVPWARLGDLVPVVSQNTRTARAVLGSTERLLEDAAASARELDPELVTVSGGQIDLAAVRRLSERLVGVSGHVDDLRALLGDSRSSWHLPTLTDQLDELERELDDNRERLDQLAGLAPRLPFLLGDGGERRYLLLLTQPSEARGFGGFPGNFVDVSVADGRISFERFGRHEELEAALGDTTATCADCPTEFIERWGRYGFRRPDGTVSARAWSNITMSPHFPYVADVAATLYPQSGGTEIDGVVAVDPHVLAQLLRYTGPIRLEDGTRLAGGNAADFLLRDQYLIPEREDRVDVLAEAGTLTMEAVLSATLPDLPTLIDDLTPLVDERRLAFWPTDPEAAAALAGAGLSGGLPEPPGVGVIVNNAAGNKIDMFLEQSVEIGTPAADDGLRPVTVTLTNAVPEGRQPNIVVGNLVDAPNGTNTMILTLYAPGVLEELRVDGEPVSFEVGREAGWTTHTTILRIPRRGTATLSFELPAGDVAGDPAGDLAVFTQATAN